MSWHLYSLNFRLKSPLHIGLCKVFHFFLTREYIPARPFWGALTAKLTRQLAMLDYEKIGEFLKTAMRFGYFYIYDKNKDVVFIPKYTDEGLKFGSIKGEEISQNDFAKRHISSLASTAIETHSFTAEEGMLHEVECISPYTLDKGEPVFVRGLLWVCEFSNNGFSVADVGEDDFSIIYGEKRVKFSKLVDTLQVGGERKYGFGLLKLEGKPKKESEKDLGSIGYCGIWEEKDDEIYVNLGEYSPLWAHVKYSPGMKAKGRIEPFVGRNWNNKGAGRELTSCGLCWSPGSILLEEKTFKITRDFGLWG